MSTTSMSIDSMSTDSMSTTSLSTVSLSTASLSTASLSTTVLALRPTASSFNDALNGNKLGQTSNFTINTFLASVAASATIFGVQVFIFLLIKGELPRLYRPRTYLVPEKERVSPPPPGLFRWLIPVFRTSNSDYIQKCGLDAYFFLRYLRLLLKIFIPMALVILPILLPINYVGGKGEDFSSSAFASRANQTTDGSGNSTDIWANVNGLNKLAWSNVRPDQTNRYWAHLALALLVIAYCCFVFYDEMRGYIRLRQAYLTSPQHRLRASATTVLVSAIPKKWCTVEALDGLYDVFPGGIRNIWINRNYDELLEKVQLRLDYARALEAAETMLIRNAKKAHVKQLKKEAKTAGAKMSKKDVAGDIKAENQKAVAMASSGGVSTGDPHQVRHTVDEAVTDAPGSLTDVSSDAEKRRTFVPIPIVGQRIEAVGHGINTLGRTVFGGIKAVGREVDNRLNDTTGFVPDVVDVDASKTYQADQGIAPGYHVPVDVSSPLNDSFQRSGHGGQGSQETAPKQASFKDIESNSRGPTPAETAGTGSRVGGDAALDERRRSKDAFGNEDDFKRSNSRLHKPRRGIFKRNKDSVGIPSPIPHGYEEDEFPLNGPDHRTPVGNPHANDDGSGSTLPGGGADKAKGARNKEEYPPAYSENYDATHDGEPRWRQYLEEKDRETMRLAIFGISWLSWVPFAGKKVDTIDYCRKELARLNLEIEHDQKHPENFPLMNSAFIQFNHQVAAHMACQAVSHHVPNQMAPRLIEISPDDVIWENMSIKWWERYLRTFIVTALVVGLVIGFAFPIAFVGFVSQVAFLASTYPWLSWLGRIPPWLQSAIQGILPAALSGLLFFFVPILLRLLARNQGVSTGMAVELAVQDYYFWFSFFELFLIITFSTGIVNVLSEIARSPGSIPTILADSLPKASNYFFSYLLLQAFSVSAGSLLQLLTLLIRFLWAPLVDNTGRQKWARQIELPNIEWGTFFPVYSNLACIGLIYSIVAPLILVFNIISFGLFWVAYRYLTLYVNRFRFDTGGLLFPKAINQLFVGLYTMELCLVGLFFLVQGVDAAGNPAGQPCRAQAIIMIVSIILTAGYQILLNYSFSSLFRYLPITLEDDAVVRDEEFARAQEKKWRLIEEEQEGDDINDVLEARERRSAEASAIELGELERNPQARNRFDPRNLAAIMPAGLVKGSWADRSRQQTTDWAHAKGDTAMDHASNQRRARQKLRELEMRLAADTEAGTIGTGAISEALFSGLHDEIEDLTPEERDRLVRRAFQHAALRARRPVVWIPRDDLGVSDDEIRRTEQFSKHIWISNEYMSLDSKARVLYKRSPPDFSELDLIEL